jgi:hypothetical protein
MRKLRRQEIAIRLIQRRDKMLIEFHELSPVFIPDKDFHWLYSFSGVFTFRNVKRMTCRVQRLRNGFIAHVSRGDRPVYPLNKGKVIDHARGKRREPARDVEPFGDLDPLAPVELGSLVCSGDKPVPSLLGRVLACLIPSLVKGDKSRAKRYQAANQAANQGIGHGLLLSQGLEDVGINHSTRMERPPYKGANDA